VQLDIDAPESDCASSTARGNSIHKNSASFHSRRTLVTIIIADNKFLIVCPEVLPQR
jgi:hypothetical protein